MRRRNSLASLLIVRNQLTEVDVATVSSVEERMRYTLSGIDVRTLATIRLRFGIPNSCKLGVCRTAEEQVLQETFAGEAEWEFVGDDVNDRAVGADLCGRRFGGNCIGDQRCQNHGQGWHDLLVSARRECRT